MIKEKTKVHSRLSMGIEIPEEVKNDPNKVREFKRRMTMATIDIDKFIRCS